MADRIKGITIEIAFGRKQRDQLDTEAAARRRTAAEAGPGQRHTARAEAAASGGERGTDKAKAGFAEKRRKAGAATVCAGESLAGAVRCTAARNRRDGSGFAESRKGGVQLAGPEQAPTGICTDRIIGTS